MKRPIGVTVVAVLAILVGIQSLGWRLWTIRDHLPMRRLVLAQLETWGGALLFGIPIFGGLICIVVGIGLWRLRRWARRLVILLSALALGGVALSSCLRYFRRDFDVDLWLRHPWPLLIPVVLYGFCLAYMFTDEVKRAFSA